MMIIMAMIGTIVAEVLLKANRRVLLRLFTYGFLLLFVGVQVLFTGWMVARAAMSWAAARPRRISRARRSCRTPTRRGSR